MPVSVNKAAARVISLSPGWARWIKKAIATPGKLWRDKLINKTYQGSYHCGKVRFEAAIDLSAGSRN